MSEAPLRTLNHINPLGRLLRIKSNRLGKIHERQKCDNTEVFDLSCKAIFEFLVRSGIHGGTTEEICRMVRPLSGRAQV